MRPPLPEAPEAEKSQRVEIHPLLCASPQRGCLHLPITERRPFNNGMRTIFCGSSLPNHTPQLYIQMSGKIAADSQVRLWPRDSHPHTFAAAFGRGPHMTGLLSGELMPTNQLSILPAGSRVHPRRDLAFLTCRVGYTGQLSSGPSARDGLSSNLSDNVRSLATRCQTLPISSSPWWNQETMTRPPLFNTCPAVRFTLLEAAC